MMRRTVVVLVACAVAGAFGFYLGFPVQAQQVPAAAAVAEPVGPWIISTPDFGPHQQAYVVFDTRRGRFATYLISGNRLQLLTVREVGPDLDLGFYGTQTPAPGTPRKRGTKRGK